ncbi:MAG: hypothetical protein FWG06_02340 [Clostridiales bacterium]|nr:hypothetical protein [Clostridiales bacterium]
MERDIKVKNIVLKCAADIFTPPALIFGFAVILHGQLSPGGGFQGGVIVASAVLLLFIGYGYRVTAGALNADALKKNEAFGASCYIALALVGLLSGAEFCGNVVSKGHLGNLISSGTIMYMNYAVGYKVLTGVGCLLLILMSLLAPAGENDQ